MHFKKSIKVPSTHQFTGLPASNGNGVVGFIPLSERCGIDDNDGVLHQSLGSNQLVVACIVHNVDDTGLSRAA